MKLHLLLSTLALVLATRMVSAQGTFFYDQQSSDESNPGEAIIGIQNNQPLGQSFIPSLSAVGFIRLKLYEGNTGNGIGTTLFINLRSTSITGPILAATGSIFLPDGFNGAFADFFFAPDVSVTPNATYYFQPVVQSGDNALVGRFILGSTYPGVEYINGQAGNNDLWFREGIIVVPEPATWALLALGVGALAWRKRSPT